MKLLLDQNISRKLVKELEDLFPGSSHVYPLGLHKAPDEKVWKRQNLGLFANILVLRKDKANFPYTETLYEITSSPFK